MRYIIETTDAGNDAKVWNTITALKDNNLISVVEKGDPVEELKENFRRIVRAQQVLESAGINREVMSIYLANKTKIGTTKINAMLNAQSNFYAELGIKLK